MRTRQHISFGSQKDPLSSCSRTRLLPRCHTSLPRTSRKRHPPTSSLSPHHMPVKQPECKARGASARHQGPHTCWPRRPGRATTTCTCPSALHDPSHAGAGTASEHLGKGALCITPIRVEPAEHLIRWQAGTFVHKRVRAARLFQGRGQHEARASLLLFPS